MRRLGSAFTALTQNVCLYADLFQNLDRCPR